MLAGAGRRGASASKAPKSYRFGADSIYLFECSGSHVRPFDPQEGPGAVSRTPGHTHNRGRNARYETPADVRNM
jgi:hypothetical protein